MKNVTETRDWPATLKKIQANGIGDMDDLVKPRGEEKYFRYRTYIQNDKKKLKAIAHANKLRKQRLERDLINAGLLLSTKLAKRKMQKFRVDHVVNAAFAYAEAVSQCAADEYICAESENIC